MSTILHIEVDVYGPHCGTCRYMSPSQDHCTLFDTVLEPTDYVRLDNSLQFIGPRRLRSCLLSEAVASRDQYAIDRIESQEQP